MKKQSCMRSFPVVLCALAVLATGGCGTSPKSNFYVFPVPLKVASQDIQDYSAAQFNIGILPVTLVPYLDRPQIVTRADKHEIRIDEYNRWGSPLQAGVVSALAGALARALPMAYIDVFPWSADTKLQYQLTVEVMMLDGVPGETANLAAQWTVTRGKNVENLVARRMSVFQEKLTDKSYPAYIEGLRSVVEQLGAEVAEIIRADYEANAQEAKVSE
ncbi:MAG: membrane integrity-associated transporter subunit PqiC [Spartobacteria bacterium]|nr:membrane integrity-associated transporter subunit PqiC [Spartobacteria bacterium]